MAQRKWSKKQRALSGERSIAGSSDDRVHLVLLLTPEQSGLLGVQDFQLIFMTAKALQQDLLGRCYCFRTVAMCSALASGGSDYYQDVAGRLAACTDPTERAMHLDARAYLQRSRQWIMGKECRVHKWLGRPAGARRPTQASCRAAQRRLRTSSERPSSPGRKCRRGFSLAFLPSTDMRRVA